METYMKDSGFMIKKMEKVFILGKMEILIQGNILMTKKLEKVYINALFTIRTKNMI